MKVALRMRLVHTHRNRCWFLSVLLYSLCSVLAVLSVLWSCAASAWIELVQCLLPGFTQAVLVVVPVTAVPPVSLPACPV